MQIDGKTAVCGLIGSPVEHTLSPLIHNTLAQVCGHNLVYVPFLTAGGEREVKAAVAGAFAMNIRGLNVTVPHKEHVLAALSSVDALAAQIGAVNTLVRTQEGYRGYNTDMTGLRRAMQSDGVTVEGESVIVLGAGGAARAVAFMLIHYGAKKVWLLNRTLPKAQQVAEEINRSTGEQRVGAMALTDYEHLAGGPFLAVQATSVGLAPDCERAVITDAAFYERLHTGYDLIYRPFETRFMQLVRQAGGRACNGLKMLLYQGIDAYELWNGVTVEDAPAERIYEKLKKELGAS